MPILDVIWTKKADVDGTLRRFLGGGRRNRLALGLALAVYELLGATEPSRLACAAVPYSQPARYQTVASVLALPPELIVHHQPARLRGVVIQSTEWGIVVVDRTGGIWVNCKRPANKFLVGDDLEIHGVTDRGLYSPVINSNIIRKLGRAPLPKPTKVNFRQLSTGDFDAQYVSLTGIVRAAGFRPNVPSVQKFFMKIEMADGTINAVFPEDCASIGIKLIGATVRLDGAGSTSKNENMQLTFPTLVMSGMENVKVLRPPPPNLFALPLTPIGRLMQFRSGTDYYHRVRVAGTVTYYKPGESLIIEDECRALLIETAQTNEIKIGDIVEAAGYPAPSPTGPILQDAILRDVAPGNQLLARDVTPAELSSGKFNYNLVSIEGRFLRVVEEPFRDVLLLQDQSSLVLAELVGAGKSSAFQNLKEGSMIRISGISLLDVTGTWHAGGTASNSIQYRLLLRSPRDVRIIQPPSWWSKTHIVYLAGVLAALTLIFLAMVVYGGVEGWRLRVVLEERERLAHEVHDTLAQSFAGIGFQLQAIRKALPTDLRELREQIDLARALVRHSHKEARLSIEPMSPETLEEVDLLTSLEVSARSMFEGGSVQVRTIVTGKPRPLALAIAVPMLRIGQEAIANAARHADPSHLEISVAHEADCVRLSIRDDGCGFVKSGGLLGFGLRGMRKRAAAISAKLEIVSHPGEGTSVEVTAPVPADLTLVAAMRRVWGSLSEKTLHVDARAKQ